MIDEDTSEKLSFTVTRLVFNNTLQLLSFKHCPDVDDEEADPVEWEDEDADDNPHLDKFGQPLPFLYQYAVEKRASPKSIMRKLTQMFKK